MKGTPPVDALLTSLNDLTSAYRPPLPVLMPRPALILLGYITSGVLLLQHATWSHQTSQAGHETDFAVFCRWVEDGLQDAVEDVRRTRRETDTRIQENAAIVYGYNKASAKL
jgi:hypothetical protein